MCDSHAMWMDIMCLPRKGVYIDENHRGVIILHPPPLWVLGLSMGVL